MGKQSHLGLKDRKKEEFQRLLEQSKDLSDLIFTEYFSVKGVVNQNNKTKISPGPTVVGGKNAIYDGGDESNLVLHVNPDKNIPVNTLLFEGNSIVTPGDYIAAKIPVYQEERVEDPSTKTPDPYQHRNKTLYFPREFKEKESAIELEIHKNEGTRKDRSVHYDFFLSKNK